MSQQSFPVSRITETRSSRRQVVKWMAGGTALAFSGILGSPGRFAAAQATPITDISAYPEVTITADNATSGDGYTFGTPDSIPTGYVKVTLENKSDAEHHAMFMQPNPDVTPDQFIEKAQTTPNFGELLSMATSVGGPGSIDPGQSATVIMNLVEGPYVLVCAVPGPDGKTPHYMMGMISEVDAKPDGTPVTTAPTAETTVELVDFAFEGLPATLAVGQHIWEVHNKGPEPHEMAVMLLSTGITADMANSMLTAPETLGTPPAAPASSPAASGQGGPPFVAVAGTAPMNPDNTVWAVLDLSAGDYVTVCFIPDPKTGKPHVDLGMFAEFTVK